MRNHQHQPLRIQSLRAPDRIDVEFRTAAEGFAWELRVELLADQMPSGFTDDWLEIIRSRGGFRFTTRGGASGDPLPDGFVVWTRVLPSTGPPTDSVEVEWKIALDDQMTRIIRHGTTMAEPEWPIRFTWNPRLDPESVVRGAGLVNGRPARRAPDVSNWDAVASQN